ncbi:hypothetical protein KI387_006864, partial [Taxus chinensis]
DIQTRTMQDPLMTGNPLQDMFFILDLDLSHGSERSKLLLLSHPLRLNTVLHEELC